MSYLQEAEKGLKTLLAGIDPEKQKAVIGFFKEKVLESYRNGLEAGERPKNKAGRSFKGRRFTKS